jgi:hypothetical protein
MKLKKGIDMQPRIETSKEKKLIGKSILMSFSNNRIHFEGF